MSDMERVFWEPVACLKKCLSGFKFPLQSGTATLTKISEQVKEIVSGKELGQKLHWPEQNQAQDPGSGKSVQQNDAE